MNAAIFLACSAMMGLTGYPLWLVAVLSVPAAVMAAHTPPERARIAKAEGTYWKQYRLLIPIMMGAFALAYLIGWLIRQALT